MATESSMVFVVDDDPLIRASIQGLLKSANLLATPHIGASTKEGQEAVGVQIARQVRDYLKFGVVQNAINLPSLTDTKLTCLPRGDA